MRNNGMIVITILLVICCMFFGCGKEEQNSKGSIYGTVTDFATGNPVPNANVLLLQSGNATLHASITGYDGGFEIPDVPCGTYSIKITKEGYSELIDNNPVVVEKGKQTKRDAQIRKLPSSLHIYDNENNEISELDFGADPGITQKTFNIFNGGSQSLQYVINPVQANWVSVNPNQQAGTVGVGVTYPIIVTINRELLADGNNTTVLTITSSTDGGKELTVKARKSSAGNGVYELPTASLMVQTEDLGRVDWASAKLLCENSTVAGFNDWRLPTKEELMTLYTNKDQIGGFIEEGYWSSSNSNSSDQYGTKKYYISFNNGAIDYASQNTQFYVRAVRTWDNSAPLVLLDNSNNEISELDFGSDANTTQKTFKIKNTGTQSIHFDVTNTASWIVNTNPGSGELSAGSTTSVIVSINRDMLVVGDNTSSLLINTPNYGGKELVIRAKKLGDGTITLETANLMVQTSDLGCVNWTSAKLMCENSTTAGYNDWRLPTKEELMILYNNKDIIGGFHVSNSAYSKYWSSSLYTSSQPYGVCFYDGSLFSDYSSKEYYVRSVRTLNGSSITNPVVTTTIPTNITSNSATCGGNVISDGGSSITERGICISLSPNPDINNSTVLTNGSETGPFTINVINMTGNSTYYVKAYAKNTGGKVGYGGEEHFTTDAFPTFQYGGETYQVAPDPGNKMTWSNANSYCNNLTINGFSGWRLPNADELMGMHAVSSSIGGFSTGHYWSSTTCEDGHSTVGITYGSTGCYSDDYTHRVRPIRLENGGGGGSAPSAPTGVSATVSGSRIRVSWNSVSNANEYIVYWSNNGSSYIDIGTTSNLYFFDDTPSEDNYYKVKARNNYGESAFSSPVYCPYSSGGNVEGWLQYDNGNGIDALGFTNGGTIYWANMFPTSMLGQYVGTSIVEIEALLNSTGTYTLQIYSGGTSSPGSLVAEINFTHNYSEFGWYTMSLPNAVTLDTSHNLWIVISKTHSAGEYPAGVCADSGDPNGRWLSDGSGTWVDMGQAHSYTWGIHTYVSNHTKTGKREKVQIISAQIKGTKIPNP